jgi:phosphoribosylanthranilate isomerase
MYVKVCGITRLDDALEAIEAGADVLGFNHIASSKRYLPASEIRSLSARVRAEASEVVCVAVVADVPPAQAKLLLERLGVDRLQLHGNEPADDLLALGTNAFKALRIADAADVAQALTFPGHPLLVDAKVQGQLGGTGQRLDWPLVASLARARALILAGGLTPENVAEAIDVVQPWAVDVASGVEQAHDPRRKDAAKMLRFVAAARGAARSGSGDGAHGLF